MVFPSLYKASLFIVIHSGKALVQSIKKYMFLWNFLAFSIIQQVLAIWSLVPLPFLNPAWSSGSSHFTYCWSLAGRILSITLLVCAAAAAAKSLQSRLTLSDPVDGSLPGSSVPGILQVRILECVRWVQLWGGSYILWHCLSLRLV